MFEGYTDYNAYTQKCAQYRRSHEEQMTLLFAYREEGDMDARDAFIEAQLLWVAQTLFNHYRSSGYLMELIQDANMQLLSLVETYDPAKAKFRSYAEPYILKQADTNRMGYVHSLRVAPNSLKVSRRLNKMMSACEADGMSHRQALEETTKYFVREEREADYDRLDETSKAAAMDCVVGLLSLSRSDLSLDAPLGDGEDDFTLMDQVSDTRPGPEQEAVEQETMDLLREAVYALPERMRFALIRYHGLFGNTKLSAVEIGEVLGVSRQRVNTILNNALEKVRVYMLGRG